MTTTYTVLVANECLRTARFVGTFNTEADADAYARAEAARSRSFCTFQVHENRGRGMVAIAAPQIRGSGDRRRNVCAECGNTLGPDETEFCQPCESGDGPESMAERMIDRE